MRSSIALMILLLFASVFAGCLGGDDALDADDPGPDDDGDGGGEGPSDASVVG